MHAEVSFNTAASDIKVTALETSANNRLTSTAWSCKVDMCFERFLVMTQLLSWGRVVSHHWENDLVWSGTSWRALCKAEWMKKIPAVSHCGVQSEKQRPCTWTTKLWSTHARGQYKRFSSNIIIELEGRKKWTKSLNPVISAALTNIEPPLPAHTYSIVFKKEKTHSSNDSTETISYDSWSWNRP